jgi:3'-phosphoadenosine 5'-phosphosulfate synthase
VKGSLLLLFGFSTASFIILYDPKQTKVLLDILDSNKATFEGPEEIEGALFANPLVQSLLQNPEYGMSRPNQTLPGEFRKHSLTAGALQGPGKFEVPAVQFAKPDGSDCIAVYYLGAEMCGWPGFVHGGLLATILDEGLARTCFVRLPLKVGMTAYLNVNYRHPCKASQFVVLRSRTTNSEGRKAWAKGELYQLLENGENGKLICEADSLFVQPRGLPSSMGAMKEAMDAANVVKR